MTKATRQRSNEGLTRCTRCRRHVVAGSAPSRTSCPFCERKTPGAFRGAALATSLLAFGCGGNEPPVEEVQEPTPVQVAEPVAEPEPTEEPTPEPTELTETDEPVEENVDTFEPAPAMQPMARYGRVPIRRPDPLK